MFRTKRYCLRRSNIDNVEVDTGNRTIKSTEVSQREKQPAFEENSPFLRENKMYFRPTAISNYASDMSVQRVGAKEKESKPSLYFATEESDESFCYPNIRGQRLERGMVNDCLSPRGTQNNNCESENNEAEQFSTVEQECEENEGANQESEQGRQSNEEEIYQAINCMAHEPTNGEEDHEQNCQDACQVKKPFEEVERQQADNTENSASTRNAGHEYANDPAVEPLEELQRNENKMRSKRSEMSSNKNSFYATTDEDVQKQELPQINYEKSPNQDATEERDTSRELQGEQQEMPDIEYPSSKRYDKQPAREDMQYVRKIGEKHDNVALYNNTPVFYEDDHYHCQNAKRHFF